MGYYSNLCIGIFTTIHDLNEVSRKKTTDNGRKKYKLHCVKSVQIQSFFWSEYRKIRNRKNFVFGHFSRSAKPENITNVANSQCPVCQNTTAQKSEVSH